MRLTSKILVLVGGIFIISATIAVFYFQAYMSKKLLDDFVARKSNEARRNANWILSKQDFGPEKTSLSTQRLHDFMRSLSSSDVTNIVIWNPSGYVVASTNNYVEENEEQNDAEKIEKVLAEKTPFIFKYENEENDVEILLEAFPHDLEIYIPIFLEDSIEGVAKIHFSNIFINQFTEQILLFFGFFLFFSCLVVFLLVSIILDYIAIGPIRKTADFAKALQRKEWDASLSIVSRGDEIGDLSSSFEYMRNSLRNTFENMQHQKEIALRAMDEADKKKKGLEDSKKAMLNVLEDIEESKELIEKEKNKYALERDRSEGVLGYLQSISEGIVATDFQNKVTFINLTASKIICREKDCEVIVGKNYSEIFKFFGESEGKYVIVDPVSEAIQSRQVFDLPRNSFLSVSSHKIPVAGSFAPIIRDGKVIGVTGIFQDITEIRRLEKEKDNFISVAAHQLRTPLSGIRWMIEMLLEGDAGDLPEEAKEILQEIFENNQRLALLVNDLLDVSRINMGKTKEDLSLIDIFKEAEKAGKALVGLAGERKVSVIFEKLCAEDPKAKVGPIHFYQSLENLISNAIKYTPEGGNVRVSLDIKGNMIIIAFADTGIGIPEKEQAKVFEKFFRASNAILKETEGSGLGLNVVKSYIEEAGGKIWFKSQEGKGTTFFVELPRAV